MLGKETPRNWENKYFTEGREPSLTEFIWLYVFNFIFRNCNIKTVYYSNAHEAVFCRETKLTNLKLCWVAVNNRGPYSRGQGGVPDSGWLMKVSFWAEKIKGESTLQAKQKWKRDVQISRICDNIEESGIKNFILHAEVGTFSKIHECESCSPHSID